MDLDGAAEAVVVGDGESGVAQPGGGGHQILGVRGAVEEAEVGVAVQLGIAGRLHGRTTLVERMFDLPGSKIVGVPGSAGG
jgi:hypothetical protein